MMAQRAAECDVLVVGGGLAALRAAAEAARTGTHVIVACKRRIGRSGSSANTTGGYAAPVTEGDTWRHHLRDTLRGGAGVGDSGLAAALCAEACDRLGDLERAGAVFHKHDGVFSVSPSGDHSRPRVVVPLHYRGPALTLPLRAWAGVEGCRFLEDLIVTDLLTDDGRVVGAVAVERLTAVPWTIRARATVLATGGAGRLFEVTSNPADVTGDGYAMALRAGARLRDLEFIQFYPWRLIRPFSRSRVPIQPSTFAAGARLYNADGERFMERVDPRRKESTTRDVAARAIFDEIRCGRGVEGGVRLDLSPLSDDDWRATNPRVAALMTGRGLDPRAVMLVVAPEAHFVMGGVAVDEDGRASLPGLFAAGEVAAGAHGANRLNSNAIPETQVFGRRAGLAAARYAGTARSRRRSDPRPRDRLLVRLAGVVGNSGTPLPGDGGVPRAEVQRAAWQGLGIVRNRDALAAAQDRLSALRQRAAARQCRGPQQLEAALAEENLCLVAQAAVHAALLREESRGAHFREDHPRAEPAWRRTIFVRWTGDALAAETVPVPPEPDDLPADEFERGPLIGEHVE